ncbi:MAG TPA: protoporphyrinogen oxidase [Planctomycetes bacterium]|nr:protoporphyrinogen oxidase [Planctomycetota bacterium]
MNTIVLGGGISGLAYAHALLQGGTPMDELLLLEAAPRLGGLIETCLAEGYQFECGPETFVDDGSLLDGLVAELGIEAQVQRPPASAKLRWLAHGGRLEPLPMGPGGLFRTPILSFGAKLRLFGEPFVRRGKDPQEDFASFIARRFGPQVLDRLADPFASGVYAGVPEQMETQACFPKLFEAEQKHGSVLRGARKVGMKPGKIFSFDQGNAQLVEALAQALGPCVHTGFRAVSLQRDGSGYQVQAEDGRRFAAERLALALPAGPASRLLQTLSPDLAELTASIPFVSVSSVHLAYRESDLPPEIQGFGFLIPRKEATNQILGVLYSSRLFPSRAPEGMVLLRALLGGARNPGIQSQPDQALVAQVRDTLSQLTGLRAEPAFVHVSHRRRALPLYQPGHSAKLATMAKALQAFTGLDLLGLSYLRSSVAGCVREARRLARSHAG